MMELEYSFAQTPWEAYLSTLQAGDTVYAGKMLALLEGESTDALEDAFRSLEEGCMNLSVEDLPRPAIAGESGLRLRREAELVKKGLAPEDLRDYRRKSWRREILCGCTWRRLLVCRFAVTSICWRSAALLGMTAPESP